MFIYIVFAFGIPAYKTRSILLAIGGIIIVICALLSSIGIISYMNVGLTMISAEVI